MKMKWSEMIVIFAVTGVITVIGNTIGYKYPIEIATGGYLILMAITLIGIALSRFLPLPMVFWISIVALLSTSPLSPFDKTILYYTSNVEFLALTTPILAFAGLSVGKDLNIFKKMSWKIVLVALAVYTGTFVFATIIAQMMLKSMGLIAATLP
jgi:hypothetical protein